MYTGQLWMKNGMMQLSASDNPKISNVQMWKKWKKQVALGRSHAFAQAVKQPRLDPENTFLDAANIHLHVPEGATPKVHRAHCPNWVQGESCVTR